jgi:hypothetical protein
VHARGASVGAQELIKDATGRTLSAAPWLRYAESKYLETEAEAAEKIAAGAVAAAGSRPAVS